MYTIWFNNGVFLFVVVFKTIVDLNLLRRTHNLEKQNSYGNCCFSLFIDLYNDNQNLLQYLNSKIYRVSLHGQVGIDYSDQKL